MERIWKGMVKTMKNLKISTKLLLAFGVVLCIFVVSIFVVRRYVKIVDDGSNYLADRIAPSLELMSAYNDNVYEIILALRSVQYTESSEAIAAYRKVLESGVAARGKLVEMHTAYPEIPAPAHVMNVVAPIARQYNELGARAVQQIEKTQALTALFTETGNFLSMSVRYFVFTLNGQLKRKIEDFNDKTAVLYLQNALLLVSGMLDEIVTLQTDSWRAIVVARAGGGIGEMKKIDDRMDNLIKKTEEMKAVFTAPEEQVMLNQLLADFAEYDSILAELTSANVELDQLHRTRNPLEDSINNEMSAAIGMAVSRVRSTSEDNIKSIGVVLNMITS